MTPLARPQRVAGSLEVMSRHITTSVAHLESHVYKCPIENVDSRKSSPSMKIPLRRLLRLLNEHPEVGSILIVDGGITFIELVQLLKPTLLLSMPLDSSGPPDALPYNVHDFLKSAIGLDHEDAKLVWRALSSIAWDLDATADAHRSLGSKYLQMFLDHEYCRGIAFYHFLPPTRTCSDPGCSSRPRGVRSDHACPRELAEALSINVTVFTQDFGPVPGISTSLYCRQCHTRYYPTYFVHADAKCQTYYPGPRGFLHSAEHVFIEVRTCQLFTVMMLVSWTSATNCARIYNDGLANKTVALKLPVRHSKRLQLDTETVWNSLFLFWLLEDCEENKEVLDLDHQAPSQAKRLQPALHARNLRMVGPGQEHWNHACDLCCWINVLPDGSITQLRSAVTDGVAIGRPTCGVHDCDIPLDSVKHRFCPIHRDRDKLCSVIKCSELASEGYKTCDNSEHRKLEDWANMQNRAMFQLKHRLERLKTSQPQSSMSSESTPFQDEEVIVDEHGLCNGKPDEGNRRPRAQFGRKRTHNEELCVASCGVILGRATFYGSEAPNGVRTFWMRLFPTKRLLPGVLWHDNNCRLRTMLDNDVDKELRNYFEHIALPVDVFHFKCKHKESDTACNATCNPYLWEELRTKDNTWRSNSSAAEQANAWIGGYQAIVREMEAVRYEFFLDEMIKRRNRQMVVELARKGKAPYSIPREELLDIDN